MNIKELPQGYKQTELGIIPEDWVIRSIKDIADIYNGGTPSTAISSYWQGDIKWCTPKDITQNKKYIFNTERTISSDGVKNSSAIIMPPGTILICTRATIGELCITNTPMATNQGFKNLVCKKNVSSELIYYIIKTIKKELITQSTGSTFLELSKKSLEKINIILPFEFKEQQAIAKALSDVDNLIEGLEKLIEKKNAIKQGVMQVLLTGKVRLPGCIDKWKDIYVSDLGKCYSGLTGKSKKDFENGKSTYIPFMNIMSNVKIDKSFLLNIQIKKNEKQNLAVDGDLFFNTSSETPEEVGMCAVLMEHIPNLYLNSFSFGFRLFDKYKNSPLFLAYYFRSEIGRKFMFNIAQGSTRYNLSKNLFYNLNITIPSTFEEQNNISELLANIDNEIAILKKKLLKYKDIKIGMMQDLLTGKIRLVQPKKQKEKIKEIDNDYLRAIQFSCIVDAFTDDNVEALGHVRHMKLSYLLNYKLGNNLEGYAKEVAGPFDSSLSYKIKDIAIDNNFITILDNNYASGKEIEKALNYATKSELAEKIDWLKSKFKYYSTNKLEVLATIVASAGALNKKGEKIDLSSIKKYISSTSKWKEKLKKPYFDDKAIVEAIYDYEHYFAAEVDA